MRRIDRIKLYEKICSQVGIKPQSTQGYLSRREMLEVKLYLESTMQELKEYREQKQFGNPIILKDITDSCQA